MKRRTVVAWMDRYLYPHDSSNWDSAALRALMLPTLRPQHDMLDFGAGAGIVPQMKFRGLVRSITGIDPDPRVLGNPLLDEAIVQRGARLPFSDCSFDVVVACNVLEHLANPIQSLKEIFRVLRPGGRFFFKTPNRLHYVALAANLTPHRFHEWYNGRRGRDRADTFPTYYMANSRRELRRLAAEAGFSIETLRVIEGRPEYLRFSPVLYLLGAVYERVVNSASLFEEFRVVVIGGFCRPP